MNKLKKSMIDVVIASDQNYFVALRTAAISLVVFNPDYRFRVHVLNGGIDNDELAIFEETVQKYSAESEVVIHYVDQAEFEGFENLRGSKMQYARLLIPSLIEAPRALYLDCDVLVLGSIRNFWEVDFDGNYAVVVKDPIVKTLAEDYQLDGVAPEVPYFNSGVMLLNLDEWRKDGVQHQVVEMIAKSPQSFRFWDQSALNVALAGKLIYADGGYNQTSDGFDLADDKVVIMHYMSRYNKPWECCGVNAAAKVWQIFYRRYVDSYSAQWRNYRGKVRYWRSLKDHLVSGNEFFYRLNITFLKAKKVIVSESGKETIDARIQSYACRRSTRKSERIPSLKFVKNYISIRLSSLSK